mgnify:CR=1 FL=1|jgi:hypothetical protein|tara:strand:- start:3928 stop:4449 length:522 start_codon:yes stop_codon:yes gene_type:complete
MITEPITKVSSRLNDYIAQCKLLGFKNNETLELMKWDWCLDQGGMWHATYDNQTIVSITGTHPFKDGYRALFRGAQLWHRRVKGLNRYQMQSWGIYDHLPLQIKFANGKPIYITTNISNDASGRMNRIHNSFKQMAKGGMVDYVGDEEVFYTQQSIWKLNNDKYFEIRKRYED